MSSFKQFIYNALIKASTPVPGVEQIQYETPEAARDAFVALVMADLFPDESAVVTIPTAKKPKSPKEPKPPKKSPEDKEAAKAAKAAEKEAAKAAKAAEKEAAKAAKVTKVTKAEPAPAAPAEPAPPAPAPTKAKKVKPAEDANVQKIDPTWRKHLKAVAKTAGKEYTKEMEAELLSYLNGLPKDAFNATKSEDHVKTFLGAAPAAVQEVAPADLEAIEVEFNGKTYYVEPNSKRVYEEDGAVHKAVGYAGMAAFAGLVIPDDA